MVGEFQYVTLIILGITFNVNNVCQFTDSPLESPNMRIVTLLLWKFSQHVYSNLDWASDTNVVTLPQDLVSCLAQILSHGAPRKKILITISSMKDDYYALGAHNVWLVMVRVTPHRTSSSISSPYTLLWNLSAVPLSHNPILHARTKHIELTIQLFHEHVIFNCMKIPHVPSSF